MLRSRTLVILATAASLASLGAGCSRFGPSAGGDVADIDPVDAAKTVVLVANNRSNDAMELRILTRGESRFVGSVGPSDSTAILLDPTMFPTGELYVIAIPPDGRGRAVGGPLAASRGNKIKFTIEPGLATSRATVIH